MRYCVALGCAALVLAASAMAGAGQATLKYNGVLGQSQEGGAAPIPYMATVGVVQDGGGAIWTGGGATLTALNWQDDKLVVKRTVSAPMGLNPAGHLMTDGKLVYFESWDGAVYSVDPSQSDSKPVKFCQAPADSRTLTMALATLSNGFAKKDRLFALSGATVRGISADGVDDGVVLNLPPLPTGTPYYSTIGIEPTSGDILVGGYYPDVNIYRYSADGSQVKDGGWPRGGFAVAIANVGGTPWNIQAGGGAQSLPTPLSPTSVETVERDWTHYAGGLVRDKAGAYWLATSQGLCHFDEHGKALHQRIGGLPDVGIVAVNSDGVLIAITDGGGRAVRLSLDDDPNASFTSNGNEPWRVAANWSGRATGIAVDGSTFLVLDSQAKQIWRFDPAQNDKQQSAWTKVGTPTGLTSPQGIAVGDSVAWILDGGNVFEGSRSDLNSTRQVVLNGASGTAHIANVGDDLLVVANDQLVNAFKRSADGTYTSQWKSDASFIKIGGLAGTASGVAVTDASGITLLDSQSGAVLSKLDAASSPGGAAMGAVAAEGSWLVVADGKNARLLRIRIEH
jgi:hypothetical protein